MGLFQALHQGVDGLQSLPGIKQLRQAAFERRFVRARAAHLFRGVYDSFDQAQAAAPPTAPVGYDNVESSNLYGIQVAASAYDYPAFYWLQRSLAEGLFNLVDLGGNTGIKFHAFKRLEGLPSQARWLVVDVTEVVQKGQSLQAAQAEIDPRLGFSDRYADIDGCDVLYASGTLQYLPTSLAEILLGLQQRPRRIVVNTTPIHPSRTFFTLNSIGTAYCPYRVQSKSRFVGELRDAGYGLRDEWINPGKAMNIPFVEGHDIADYSGFCFDRQG